MKKKKFKVEFYRGYENAPASVIKVATTTVRAAILARADRIKKGIDDIEVEHVWAVVKK